MWWEEPILLTCGCYTPPSRSRFSSWRTSLLLYGETQARLWRAGVSHATSCGGYDQQVRAYAICVDNLNKREERVRVCVCWHTRVTWIARFYTGTPPNTCGRPRAPVPTHARSGVGRPYSLGVRTASLRRPARCFSRRTYLLYFWRINWVECTTGTRTHTHVCVQRGETQRLGFWEWLLSLMMRGKRARGVQRGSTM